MNQELIKKVNNILTDKKNKIINSPSSKFKKVFGRKKKISIITPCYNAEDSIERCINSVVGQSFPFEEIEFIIVDDNSTDSTRDILSKFANKFKNITVVYLNENTGTAGMPRNIALELHTTEKVMFLDADDWLHTEAVIKMVNKMDENNDDLVIGQTIKVSESGESIHAEFISYESRDHIKPLDMPYLYYYMGPQSKIIKSSVIMNNSIRFPELKFGEDKSFFFGVLNNIDYVSTINEPIHYLNRFSANNQSLTKVTSTLEKRMSDIKILKKVYAKNFPLEQEKVMMKRLVEYDFLRTCDSYVFIRSNEKEKYISLIREALNILSERDYDIIESFDSSIYKLGAKLVREKKDEEFIKLFTWYKSDKNKKVIIKNNLPFYDVPVFDKTNERRYISIPLYARATETDVENNNFVQCFEVYGEKIDSIENIIIRDRNRVNNELELQPNIENNKGTLRLSLDELSKLETSLFSIYLRYDGHRLLNIKRLLENSLSQDKREFTLYSTKANNLGFAIKNK